VPIDVDCVVSPLAFWLAVLPLPPEPDETLWVPPLLLLPQAAASVATAAKATAYVVPLVLEIVMSGPEVVLSHQEVP
jgi:hypothetical protein